MNGTTHLKIGDINKNLICTLCGGYYIDATTIIECLHSFCRTCIVTYLRTGKTCPVCDTVVHKARPHQNIRSDKLLQDLVYKLVPGLYRDEMRRRREFYTQHYEAAPKRPGEERGDEMSDRFTYTEEEKISLALHFCREGVNERADFRRVFTSKETLKARVEKRIKDAIDVRFLHCKAAVTIGHLKRFVRIKYGLSPHFQVDMFFNDEPLRNSCTLCDVAYFFNWRRRAPLTLNFCVFENPRKHNFGKQGILTMSSTSTKTNSTLPNPVSPSTTSSSELSAVAPMTTETRQTDIITPSPLPSNHVSLVTTSRVPSVLAIPSTSTVLNISTAPSSVSCSPNSVLPSTCTMKSISTVTLNSPLPLSSVVPTVSTFLSTSTVESISTIASISVPLTFEETSTTITNCNSFPQSAKSNRSRTKANPNTTKPKPQAKLTIPSKDKASTNAHPKENKSVSLGKRSATTPIRIAPAPAKNPATTFSSFELVKIAKNPKTSSSPKLVSLLPASLSLISSPKGAPGTPSTVTIPQTLSASGVHPACPPKEISRISSPVASVATKRSRISSPVASVAIKESRTSSPMTSFATKDQPSLIKFSVASLLNGSTKRNVVVSPSESNKHILLNITSGHLCASTSSFSQSHTFPIPLPSFSFASSHQTVSIKESKSHKQTSNLIQTSSLSSNLLSLLSSSLTPSSTTVSVTSSSHNNSVGSPKPATSASPTPAAVPIHQSQTQGSDTIQPHAGQVSTQNDVPVKPVKQQALRVSLEDKKLTENRTNSVKEISCSDNPKTDLSHSSIGPVAQYTHCKEESETSLTTVALTTTNTVISSVANTSTTHFSINSSSQLSSIPCTASEQIQGTISPVMSPTSDVVSTPGTRRKPAKQKKIADIANTLHKRVNEALLQMVTKRSGSPSRRSSQSPSLGKKAPNNQHSVSDPRKASLSSMQGRQSLQNCHQNGQSLNNAVSSGQASNLETDEPLNLVKLDKGAAKPSKGMLILDVPQSLK